MAVTGRKPKEDGQKVTRHPLTHQWIDVLDVPYDGPRPKLSRVPAATKAWWEAVSTLPHCILWRPGDWQFAIDTARVHADFIRSGRGATELRARERAMGTTVDAARDLRIRYVDRLEEERSPATVDAPDHAERFLRLLDA